MTVFGVSQSTGVERVLKVERGGEGVVLTMIDDKGNVERDRTMVRPDALLMAVIDAPAGGTAVEGTAVPQGVKKLLDIEIRRNEVWLRTRDEAGAGWDVAVGLDDLQDA